MVSRGPMAEAGGVLGGLRAPPHQLAGLGYDFCH